ncbi:EpsG family protein [Lactobacillus helveticus]|uniref:EpsG family protein n=1 Tax=Lactobacillus helveticus TaxID=1587 RepID=UPI001565BD8D|nr:EpsG family protein [Lactobacillus helveticus]NRO45074.1 hypothetical protein [Lactobacillus helveticus]
MTVILLSTILLGSGLIVKRSKLIFIVSIIFLWLLMTFTYGNADEPVYLSRYNSPELWTNSTEYLFQAIINVSRNFGLSFIAFKGIVSTIEIALIGKTVWRFSKYPNVVLLLYFFTSFAYNVTQIRFALASSIFIYSLQYLFTKNTMIDKRRIILSTNECKFIIGILIASFIHASAILWLILLVAKKSSIKVTIVITIIFNLLILFSISSNFISSIFQSFGSENRMSAYLSEAYQNSSFRILGQMKLVLFAAFFEIIICMLILKNRAYFKDICQIKLLTKLNIIILIILGIMLRYTAEVYRLQESLFLVNYIFLLNTIPSDSFIKSKTKVPIFFIEGLIVIMVIGISYLELFSSANFITVWKPIFFNNLLFN